MNRLLLLPLAAIAFSAAAQTPITLTQATFPATTSTVEQYQDAASNTSFAATPTGANQSWDYHILPPSTNGPYVVPYLPVPASGGLPGAQWTRDRVANIGRFTYNYTGYYRLATTGRLSLGRTVPRQALSLTPITGGATDSVTVNRQTVAFGPSGLVDFPLPLTTGSVQRSSLRIAVTGTLTAQAFSLNQAPFRIVQRYTLVDSVAGSGTAQVPVMGRPAGSGPVPVLQVRGRSIRQDSLYLNGSPAPAALLQALTLTQGAITAFYYDEFWRNNSAQPLLSFAYPSAQYGIPTSATYSTETTVLAARPPAPAATFQAWPNPLPAGRDLQLELTGRPSRLTVRDAQGRRVAEDAAPTSPVTGLLRGLPAGLYWLEVETAAGRAARRVVVE